MSDQWPVSAVRLCVPVVVCALALVAVPTQAEDGAGGASVFSVTGAPLTPSVRSLPLRPAYVPVQAERFVSSVNVQMEALSAFTKTSEPGRPIHDNFMYEEHTREVERSLLRMTRSAFRDYMMEVTTVNQLIERYKSKGMKSVGLEKLGGSLEGNGSRFGFDFGFSHFRPEVGLEYEVGRSSFKLSVDGNGQAGFRYRNPRWGGNQVSLGYDGDDVYYVSWHVAGF